jgi:hypothetical protein
VLSSRVLYCPSCLRSRLFLDIGTYLLCEGCALRLRNEEPPPAPVLRRLRGGTPARRGEGRDACVSRKAVRVVRGYRPKALDAGG